MQMTFMTNRHLGLSKFIKELGLVAEYFKWDEPSYHENIRQCWYIRGYHSNGMRFCPITAVAYALNGVNYRQDKWTLAAEAINMPLDLAELIVKAADGGVAFDSENADLHERLLKTVGL